MDELKKSRRESDLSTLAVERKANALPWSLSPFRQPGSEDNAEEITELEPGEIRVIAAEEVPFIDLLLEIAMTTAFASLTDGTPILQYNNVLSYVAFFLWVWWVWIAQVAYNMRFRQADWFHRIMVFVQLIVFSAMAAFADQFDITNGIANNPDQAEAESLLTAAGFSKNELDALMFRNNRIPLLNARGISMAMALSRIVLLVQYLAVFYYARKQLLPRNSLWAHILPLILSSACFFVAFGILYTGGDDGPSVPLHIVKLLLWYLPLLVEIAGHFVALELSGFVRYTTESIYARSGTVFLIILGAGLDKITGGFKQLVGNAGLGSSGIPIFISAAVIFIGFFSLYFGTPGSNREISNRRALSWLFSQFIFLSALTVTLQAVANSISFMNLSAALSHVDDAIGYAADWEYNQTYATNLTATDFPESIRLFNELGLAFEDVVDSINSDLYQYSLESTNDTDNNIWIAGILQEEMIIFSNLLNPDTLNALPDKSSLLFAKLYAFTYADQIDELTYAKFLDIYSGILKDRGSSALWLYPAAGATILGLVLMSCIKGMPRDKYEWGVLGTRCTIGTATTLLALLDIGASKPIVETIDGLNSIATDSKIWILNTSDGHWLLILLAIIMGILQITENLFAYTSSRQYTSFQNLDFLNGPERRKTKRGRKPVYQRTYSVDADDYSVPLVPYSPGDKKEAGYGYTYPNPYEEEYHDRDTKDMPFVNSPKHTLDEGRFK
ncbi:hypothetical protein FIBSPDRAFT_1038145 [Athelia psychrophila]|uniref:Low temperature requirement A n=1 Tax=Athelia psychrophila TaxID=1759441 RepID=A0A166TCP3_9AGAM|nr:hypothetical protein FIBSPDRAFT_1038145 [Fibularhizoctonia sp. CBS 109695]